MHSYKKRKDSLETRAVLLIISLELEISGVAVQSIHENAKRGCFSHFLLLWPWCQDFWGSSEDRYGSKRISQMLLVCYNFLNSQNMPISQQLWKMVGYKDTSNVARKTRKLHRKKSNNQPMVSFIHYGSEIITAMMGHSFKTKSTKSRVTFLR